MPVDYFWYSIAAVFSLLPLAIVTSTRRHAIMRRQQALADDFRAANNNDSHAFRYFVQSRGGIENLQKQVRAYMTDGLWLPLAALTILNAVGFALLFACLQRSQSQLGPISYGFVGAYLFNLGVMIRRLSFNDLNVQMIWSAINRVALSVGICLVLMGAPGASSHGQLFFAVGFLSNLFLESVLTAAQKVAAIREPKRNDGMSLQMVRGIDFWKAQRLEEEGIENIQNLATADVLDLAVRTHYNLSTLVDWIDQAIVIARFRTDSFKLERAGLNISSIDLAWSSPAYSGESSVADEIARVLDLKPAFVVAQMNSLYEDQFVRNLWTLWQTRPGYVGQASAVVEVVRESM